MAHLKTLATTRNLAERAEWKWILTQKLYERGLADGDIIKLFGIIDTMMTLSKPLQAELAVKIKHLEESLKMPLISPTMELAREEGREKGREEGREEGELIGEQRGELKGNQKLVIKLLNRRIGELKPPVIEQIRKLPVEQLEELAEALLDFSTVANLEHWLNSRPKSVES
jgi:predicted transposase YdaD